MYHKDKVNLDNTMVQLTDNNPGKTYTVKPAEVIYFKIWNCRQKMQTMYPSNKMEFKEIGVLVGAVVGAYN